MLVFQSIYVDFLLNNDLPGIYVGPMCVVSKDAFTQEMIDHSHVDCKPMQWVDGQSWKLKIRKLH